MAAGAVVQGRIPGGLAGDSSEGRGEQWCCRGWWADRRGGGGRTLVGPICHLGLLAGVQVHLQLVGLGLAFLCGVYISVWIRRNKQRLYVKKSVLSFVKEKECLCLLLYMYFVVCTKQIRICTERERERKSQCCSVVHTALSPVHYDKDGPFHA